MLKHGDGVGGLTMKIQAHAPHHVAREAGLSDLTVRMIVEAWKLVAR